MKEFLGDYGFFVAIILFFLAVVGMISLYHQIWRAGYLKALEEYHDWIQVGCDAAKKKED